MELHSVQALLSESARSASESSSLVVGACRANMRQWHAKVTVPGMRAEMGIDLHVGLKGSREHNIPGAVPMTETTFPALNPQAAKKRTFIVSATAQKKTLKMLMTLQRKG